MGILEDDLNALEACNSVVEIRAVFQRIIEDCGFSSFGFMDASHPWEDDPLLVSTHSAAWIDTYRSENFISTDPCLSAARRTNLPFHWGSVALPPVTGKRKPGAVRKRRAHDPRSLQRCIGPPVYQRLRTILEGSTRHVLRQPQAQWRTATRPSFVPRPKDRRPARRRYQGTRKDPTFHRTARAPFD